MAKTVCIDWKWVNVRKDTQCFGCCRVFPKGTLMESQTMRDTSLWHIHLCSTCEKLVNSMVADNDVYDEGTFKTLAPAIETASN